MTIRENYIPLDCPSEWKLALEGIKHSFGHTWENCYAMHLTTGFNTYLYSFEADDIRIICPIAEREYDGYVDIVKPFGFSGYVGTGVCPEFSRYWRESAKQRGYICGYLGLNPILDSGINFDQDEVYQYDTIHVLDLKLGHDELWGNLSANRKRQLKDWDNISSKFVFDRAALSDCFLTNYVDFFIRKNAAQFYFFSKDTLSFLFNLDNVIMVGAPNVGTLEAVSVFAYTADVGEYLFNVSLPGGEKYATSLIWYGLQYLKSLKIPFFNLGGGSGGVGESKRRYGTRALPLKCIKQVYAPDIYIELCRRANVDPNDMAGYFPHYRKRS